MHVYAFLEMMHSQNSAISDALKKGIYKDFF